MKRSFALIAVLGVALTVVLTQPSVRSGPAASQASRVALAAQARAAFNKYMSSHATFIRAHAQSGATVGRGATVPHVRPHVAAATVTSGGVQPAPGVNWGGYADQETGSSTVSGVSGHWTIPRVTCLQGSYRYQDAFAAQWVGIDGFSDGTVEQLGSGEQCYEGVLYYYVWYEMYPNGTVQEGTTQCINDNVDCPRPGDQISASVNVTSGGAGVNNYTLTLTDATTRGNNFSVTQPCATSTCQDSSGEWIIERPATELSNGLIQILPLVDFDQNAFSNGTVTSGGVTSSIAGFRGGTVYDVLTEDDTMSYYLDCVGQSRPPDQLLLVSNANACPTVAPVNGNSFSDTWDTSF
ncbi:MAG TPA: G1 family glutamic endopeptidase [Solirubrobacteraceae bacterium]|nr:G1 family glutamic endopeptidase [Solirubrobacteraceae bacterium]